MQEIPLEKWGNQVSQAVPSVQLADRDPRAFVKDSGMIEAKALTGLGQDVVQTADMVSRELEQRRREAERLARQQEAKQQAAESAASYASTLRIEDAASGALEEIGRQPELSDAQARSQLQSKLDSIQESNKVDITNGEVRVRHDAAINHVRAQMGQRLDGFLFKKGQDSIKGHLMDSIDSIRRLNPQNPEIASAEISKLVDATGPHAGMGADEMQKLKQTMSEKVFFDSAVSDINDQPREALKSLTDGEAYLGLAQDDRNTLIMHARSAVERLDGMAEREQNKREVLAREAVGSLTDRVSRGYNIPPDEWRAAEQAARGTPYEETLRNMKTNKAELSAFTSRSIPKMMAEVSAGEKQNDSVGMSVQDASLHVAKRQTLSNLLQDLKKDAMAAYKASGFSVTDIDMSSPQTISTSMAARVKEHADMSAWAGTEGLPMLTKDEAGMIATILDAQSPEAQRLWVMGISKAMNNPAERHAFFSSLTPGMGGYLASAAQMSESSSPEQREGSFLLLRGMALQKNKESLGQNSQVRLPEMSVMEAGFDSRTMGVYTGNATARSTDMRNAIAIYAALAEDHGIFVPGADKQPDPTLMSRAVKLATGGIVEYNGKNITVSPETTPDAALKAAGNILVDMRQKGELFTNMTPEGLRNLPFRNSSRIINGVPVEGFEVLALRGTSVLVGSDGMPVFLPMTEVNAASKIDRMDFTNRFNTELSPADEEKFQAWRAKLPTEDLKSMYNYDLRGAFKDGAEADYRNHMTDKYKKPNHPTFSEQSIWNGVSGFQGGKWSESGGTTFFEPGPKNMHSRNALKGYFDKNEPKARLIDPRGGNYIP